MESIVHNRFGGLKLKGFFFGFPFRVLDGHFWTEVRQCHSSVIPFWAGAWFYLWTGLWHFLPLAFTLDLTLRQL
jgi:hypothetical protein